MKLSVVLLAVLVASAYADDRAGREEWHKKAQEMYKICMEENGVSNEELKESRGQEDPDRKVKCFEACLSEKRGFMTADGTIDIAKLTDKFAGKEKMLEAFKQCAASITEGQDKCDAAWAMKMCMRKLWRSRKHKKQETNTEEA